MTNTLEFENESLRTRLSSANTMINQLRDRLQEVRHLLSEEQYANKLLREEVAQLRQKPAKRRTAKKVPLPTAAGAGNVFITLPQTQQLYLGCEGINQNFNR